MSGESANSRIEAALTSEQPAAAVAALTRQLVSAGMPKAELHQLLDTYRAKHHGDEDETRYDAILNAMDLIDGFCAPSQQI